MVPRLQIIGGGKMGEALLSGLLARGWAAVADVRIVEKLPDRADALRAAFPGLTVAPEPSVAEGHLIAVKPGDVAAVCAALAGEGSRTRVLSIAAGVTLQALEATLAPDTPVVRAMPNTPALVGAGVAAIAAGRDASD